MGQGGQPLGQRLDPLPVEGVDRNRRLPHQLGQPGTGHQLDLMALAILLVHRVIRILPMIVITRLAIDLLVNVASQGHVDLLHAAADPEDRQAAVEGGAHQGNIEQIPVPVLRLLRGEVLLAIEGRIDVGASTAQIDPVGEVQILLQILGATAGGHQQRHAAADLHQRLDVFVGHDLVGVATAGLGPHGHQHDGFVMGTGVGHRSPWLSLAVSSCALGRPLPPRLARACLKAWSWDQGRASVPESSVSLGNDSLDPASSLPRPFNMSNKMMQLC